MVEKIESGMRGKVYHAVANKAKISMCIYGIQKNGTDEPICRAGIQTQTQKNGLMDTVGEGEGGMN